MEPFQKPPENIREGAGWLTVDVAAVGVVNCTEPVEVDPAVCEMLSTLTGSVPFCGAFCIVHVSTTLPGPVASQTAPLKTNSGEFTLAVQLR